MAHQKTIASIGGPGRIDRSRHAVKCRQCEPIAAVRYVEQQAVVPARLVYRRKDADVSREMHQAVAPAPGQIEIGDGAVQPVRRVNGEVCGAVELLVGPDIAEFPAGGERLAGLDLEPDNSHCAPPHSCGVHLYHQFAAPAHRSASRQKTGHNLKSGKTTRRAPL
ncbi:MAG: hypothetical protein ACREE2_17985 [Stellaceae bacterium]